VNKWRSVKGKEVFARSGSKTLKKYPKMRKKLNKRKKGRSKGGLGEYSMVAFEGRRPPGRETPRLKKNQRGREGH